MNTFAMWFGYAVLVILALLIARPLARGLSYGLYETVVFYKCGISMWRVFKRFVRAVFVDLFVWGLLNSGVENTSNNESSWSGIFRWSFRKTFTRAAGKKWNAQQAAAKRKAAMDADI